MKITFLGTCHGYPEKNRDYSSVLIEAGGFAYLIDAGAAVTDKLVDRGIGFDKLRAVFITHIHGDHMLGLLDLIGVINVKHYAPVASVDYYLPEERGVVAVKNYVEKICTPLNPEKCRFHVYGDGFVYDDGVIRLTAIPTSHLKDKGYPAYAFVVEAEGKKLLFSGDMSPNLKHGDFPEIAKRERFDIIVCELAHFDFEVIRPHLKDCLAERVYINHVKYPDERIPLLDKENKSGEFPFEIIGANDGDVILL